jgi:hypothetical protein
MSPLFGTGETNPWRVALAIVLLLLVWLCFAAVMFRRDQPADESDQAPGPAEQGSAGPASRPCPDCSAEHNTTE